MADVSDTERGSEASIGQPLMGTAEIAKLFQVSRQRVYQLSRHPDWPEPVARLAMGPVWRTQDIRHWAKAHGRDTC